MSLPVTTKTIKRHLVKFIGPTYLRDYLYKHYTWITRGAFCCQRDIDDGDYAAMNVFHNSALMRVLGILDGGDLWSTGEWHPAVFPYCRIW